MLVNVVDLQKWMNVVTVMVITLLVQTVLVCQMEVVLKIIAEPVMPILPMTVYRIVRENGVEQLR